MPQSLVPGPQSLLGRYMKEKRCYRCKSMQPLDNLYKNRSTKDGYGNICKPCGRARQKEDYRKDPEKWHQIDAKSRKKNYARVLETNRNYLRNNPQDFSLLSSFKQFATWDLVLWGILIGCGAALEIVGLIHKTDATFTAICRATLPRWLMAGLIGWLTYHFLLQSGK